MRNSSNIITTDDYCIIYPRKQNYAATILGHCAVAAFFVIVTLKCYARSRHPEDFPWIFWGIFYIVLAVGFYVELKRVKKPLKPLQLSKKGILLPNGEEIKWKDVDSIHMRYHLRVIPDFCIRVKVRFPHTSINGERSTEFLSDVMIIDWGLYASKKELITLMEKYAGRTLYHSLF